MSVAAILGKLAGDTAGGVFGGIADVIGSIRGAITGKEALTSDAVVKIQELLAELESKLVDLQSQIVAAQERVITAEAQGESWLQRNWRPTTMLTFLTIILYQAFCVSVFGFPSIDMTSVPDKMWELLKIGLGGYIVGRSVEKSVKSWKGN